MVSDRERAQLILIGAILIATIIFGLSVLLNSLVFTGASGGTGAEAALGETDLAGFEIQRNVRALIVRVNHADRSVTWNELETRIEENVTRFSRLLAESKAASSSIAVNVSYNNSTSEGGWRIVQAHDDDFRDNTNTNPWDPVPGAADATVGWFTVNVDVENTTATSSDPFTVVASNSTGYEIAMEISENSGNVSVDSSFEDSAGTPIAPPIAPPSTPTCGSTSGRVLLDLYQGSGFVDDCKFNGTSQLNGTVTIRFEGADNINGKYSIVVDKGSSEMTDNDVNPYRRCKVGGFTLPENDADPCLTPAIWSANLTTTVHGDGISYESAYNLSLYTEVP